MKTVKATGLKIDFHIHSTFSDGTDSPAAILRMLREGGFTHFSLTDHDTVNGGAEMARLLTRGDPAFIFGAEFSCEDESGKYHILAYGYDPAAPSVNALVDTSHGYRVNRVKKRLELLKRECGFSLTEAEREALFALNNPGKPHIAEYMIKYGYAATIGEAFENYLNKFDCCGEHVRPEDAVRAIVLAGGIPVLAHAPFGSGNQLLAAEEVEARLKRFIPCGLRGLEGYYSKYTYEMQSEMLSLADKYDLFVTVGSDYHGTHKTVLLGETHLEMAESYPDGLLAFLREVEKRKATAAK